MIQQLTVDQADSYPIIQLLHSYGNKREINENSVIESNGSMAATTG